MASRHALRLLQRRFSSSKVFSKSEFDELAQRAKVLKEENVSLRADVSRIRSEHEQLLAQNAKTPTKTSGGATLTGLLLGFGFIAWCFRQRNKSRKAYLVSGNDQV